MPCYIIACGDSGKVKIGWAAEPDVRCKELQTAHHELLRIIRLIVGPRATEQWMQRHFKADRIRLEWFHFRPEMLTIRPPSLPERNRLKPEQLGGRRRRADDPKPLHPLTVRMLEQCGNDPELYVLRFMQPGPRVAKLRADIRKAKNAAHGPLMVQDYIRLWRDTVPFLQNRAA